MINSNFPRSYVCLEGASGLEQNSDNTGFGDASRKDLLEPLPNNPYQQQNQQQSLPPSGDPFNRTVKLYEERGADNWQGRPAGGAPPPQQQRDPSWAPPAPEEPRGVSSRAPPPASYRKRADVPDARCEVVLINAPPPLPSKSHPKAPESFHLCSGVHHLRIVQIGCEGDKVGGSHNLPSSSPTGILSPSTGHAGDHCTAVRPV